MPFTKENLEAVWNDYLKKLKAEEKSPEQSVLNQPYELKEDFQIELKLANTIQEDILDRFRTEFVQYLRNSLKNSSIKLSTSIVQEETKQRLYTSQDKFNYMVKVNPKLLDLKQRLGLDYDY